MALRATMSRSAAKPAAPQGFKAAVQKVVATAGVSVASLALALSASADVSRPLISLHARCLGPLAAASIHPATPQRRS